MSLKIRIRSERNFWSGLVFLATGIGFAWGSLGYNFGNSAQPGPGYFPFGLGILLALLGGGVVFEALTVDTADGEKIGAWAWKPVIWITLSVALFGFSLPYLGLVLALPLLVVITAMAGDEFRWGEAVFSAAILTLGSWAVFIKGLKLLIPLWPSFLVN